MKNTAFMFKLEEEKAEKLGAVLRAHTNDALPPEHVLLLLSSVSLNRQYSVCVHTDPHSFHDALSSPISKNDVVAWQFLFGLVVCSGIRMASLINENSPAAAITWPSNQMSSPRNTPHTILIYIPHHQYMKGQI